MLSRNARKRTETKSISFQSQHEERKRLHHIIPIGHFLLKISVYHIKINPRPR